EINSTFYRSPEASYAARWVERVEERPSFRFTAKLWRRFTHQREEAWTRSEADATRDGFAPLLDAGRLDALLLQFPWSFKRGDARLEWLADLRDGFASFPLVVEVRHASWDTPAFYGWLAREGLGFVNIDQPR